MLKALVGKRSLPPPGTKLTDLVKPPLSVETTEVAALSVETTEVAALNFDDTVQLPIEQELEVIPRSAEYFQFMSDDLDRCRERLDKNYRTYEVQYLEVICDRVSALELAGLLDAGFVDAFDLSLVSIHRFITELQDRLAEFNVPISDSLQQYFDNIVN